MSVPPYEQDQPYGRWSPSSHQPAHWQKPSPKPYATESVLHSAEIQVERKFFTFQIRENSRGRILRITEEGNGKRNSIIIPASGLKDFQALVEEISKAAEGIPPKGENPS